MNGSSGFSQDFRQQMVDESNRMGEMAATMALQGDSAMAIQGVLEEYLLGGGREKSYVENIEALRNLLRLQLPWERFPNAWHILERKAPFKGASAEDIERWVDGLPPALEVEMLEMSKITVYIPFNVRYILSIIVPLQKMATQNAVAPEMQPLIRSYIRQLRSTLPEWAVAYRKFIDTDWEEGPALLPGRRVSKKERRTARHGALPKRGR